ncbi:10593_t:CDS:2 [Cetraspora pellucida]|uniref:10593_t:CDS:1 n=1 Tax=Cetraspora pellucida TaxID=1433469 RepID=A0A9N9PB50_9GLOM|nr:10593_t:CDS:2 [Cetraspora pellucida]
MCSLLIGYSVDCMRSSDSVEIKKYFSVDPPICIVKKPVTNQPVVNALQIIVGFSMSSKQITHSLFPNSLAPT